MKGKKENPLDQSVGELLSKTSIDSLTQGLNPPKAKILDLKLI